MGFIIPDHFPVLLGCPVLTLTCQLSALSTMHRSLYGHSEWSAMQLRTQQGLIYWSEQALIFFCNMMCYRLHRHVYMLLCPCGQFIGCPSIDHFWSAVTPFGVTQNNTCTFEDALTHLSSHQYLAPVKVPHTFTPAHFSASNTPPLRTKCILGALYVPPTDRRHCNELINVFNFIYQWLKCYGCLCVMIPRLTYNSMFLFIFIIETVIRF